MLGRVRGPRAGAQQWFGDMAILRLFGSPMLERDGSRTQIGAPPKGLALLGIIAANHARPLSREWLAQSLWPDSDPADARANLRRQLHLLAKSLGEDVFTLTRHTAQWNAAASTGADVINFETLASAESALALQEYGGDFCAGVDDELLDGLRLRYRSRYEDLLRKLIENARASGDQASLALWLQRAVNHDPFDESSVRDLMELRERHGDRAGALREYHALAHRLRGELGVEPEAETLTAFNRILYGAQPATAPNNLSASATSFVGRDEELASVAGALKTARFVSITGPGGVGKTRLAVRWAFNAVQLFPDGVWFIELVNATDAYSIWNAIGEVLGITADERRDEAVLGALTRSRTLLVLDNCEHVFEALGPVVDRLLANTSVRVVATSRRHIGAQDEASVELQPLEIPPANVTDSETLLRYPAYRLFVERATTISPAFRVTPEKRPALARILRRLDGLPLAIELVASRAHMLTLEGMLKRLGPAGAIDAAIAWSFDLLSPPERGVFARLGVFHGKFSIDAVEAICGGEQAVASLFEIVEASLAQAAPHDDTVHYTLPATTRGFARARLVESGEEQSACRRHAHYFASLVEHAAELGEAEYDRFFSTLQCEMDDLIAALAWCVGARDLDTGVTIANGICRERQRRGYSRETLAALEALLASADGAEDTPRLARAHRVAGILANTCTDLKRARFHNERAYEMYRRLGDAVPAAYACAGIALAAQLAGEYAESERLLRQAVAELEHSSHTPLLARTLNFLGEMLVTMDRLPEARDLTLRAAQLHRSLGEHVGLGLALKNLALIAYRERDYTCAGKILEEVLTCHAVDNDVYRYVDAINLQADVFRASGRIEDAMAAHLAALEFRERLAGSHLLAETLERTALTLERRNDARSAVLLASAAQGLRTRMRAPMSPHAAKDVNALTERLRAQLGEAEYGALWIRGQTEDVQALSVQLRCAGIPA
ncbi:MAG TPA: BTAD domain-containing putative transcriptional regulator [Candidatus Baltobacteraceae bacterium]|nr:BTAD domain-containing putative transcriptional regulator [Candidatus Baltobacteraceae bacterium]